MRRIDARTWSVAGAWELDPDGLVGLTLAGTGCTVRRHDPEKRTLTFDGDAPLQPGAELELQSDESAPLFAARLLTGTPRGKRLPPCVLRVGTTVGTNALLEQRGARVALFLTEGFADLLEIGDQRRPDLFALSIDKPGALHAATVEVAERLSADGTVLHALDLASLRPRAQALLAEGVDVAVVALLHADRNPEHERRVAETLRGLGFSEIVLSHRASPRIKLLDRATTAVIDGYLAPGLGRFVEDVRAGAGSASLLVMTSSGGLLDAAAFRPKDGLLSGPAAGVVGCAAVAKRSGFERCIGFDMGGTSTDVSRFDGDHDFVDAHRVGTATVSTRALAIETVAAGGGSVCWVDGQRLRVGPQSAGSRPGPACYGAGGPLTLTDVNLLLGRLDGDRFPIPLHVAHSRRRLDELLRQLREATGEETTAESVLEGLLGIADETMAGAVRAVSVRRGYDPREYALISFGGAGGQHACAVASRLGISTVLVPQDAAILSAYGLQRAQVTRSKERQLLKDLDRVEPILETEFEALEREARGELESAGWLTDERPLSLRRSVQLRYHGQESTLEIDWSPRTSPRREFDARYATIYGHRPDAGRPLEVVGLHLTAGVRPEDEPASPAVRSRAREKPVKRLFLDGEWSSVPCLERESIARGDPIDGPTLILESNTATLVPDGWHATRDDEETLVLKRRASSRRSGRGEPLAVRTELFTQRFRALVAEMGQRLERTSVSTNVKERLDFSCALLDPAGRLVVNAPHIPVHLGALGLCVRAVARALSLKPGDVVVTNHPRYGGSHLPDVTVITPVFHEDDRGRLLGYVASRAHHAEIGGTRPGSMPPKATRLVEEGVVLSPTLLVEGGEPRFDALAETLRRAPHPSRNVGDNLADLRAAVAANQSGRSRLVSLAREHGADLVLDSMDRLRELSARRTRAALESRAPGEHTAVERLDDGTTISVSFRIEDGRCRVDFHGCSAVHPGNLNATPAIVHSCLLYVLRLLVPQPLPLNDGLLEPVEIDLPESFLNPPFPEDPEACPAVVGGNVETSQRLVDTLLRALDLSACSQGTMNNVIFGNDKYGYYETLGGGTGAGPGFAGAHAVHSHMTNTRITDAEVLERRYPVRLVRFARRRGSGGRGEHDGGDGLIREYEFTEPAAISLLTQHRVVAPYGLRGGEDGATGSQVVVRRDGSTAELGSIDQVDVEAGDRLRVETPGGGGYGRATARE